MAQLTNSQTSNGGLIDSSVNSEAEKQHSDQDAAPDGGLQAWLVAAGASCIIFSALGFVSTFGVFQQYYGRHQLRGRSEDEIAWIGSVASFLQLAMGTVSGPLFDRYGTVLIRPAAVVYVFAIMMLSLCDEYWQFMVAQGFLIGIVTGCLQFPAMAAVSQFFDKKRAAALGLAVAGSSIGGVVMPLILSKMLNGSSLGFGWSVRIVGFVMVPFMAFACVTVRSRLPPKDSTFFIAAAFKEQRYVLLIAALFFLLLGMFVPLFFIPSYAVSRGTDATLASYFLAIINAASTFGRIIPGIMADKLGRLNVFAFGGAATGIVLLCLTLVRGTAGLVVYAIAIGFSSGTIVSGGSAAMSFCPKDPRNIGTYLGMGIAVCSVAALIGPPINGAFISNFNSFLPLSLFSGLACIFGSCIAFASKTTTPEGLFGKV